MWPKPSFAVTAAVLPWLMCVNPAYAYLPAVFTPVLLASRAPQQPWQRVDHSTLVLRFDTVVQERRSWALLLSKSNEALEAEEAEEAIVEKSLGDKAADFAKNSLEAIAKSALGAGILVLLFYVLALQLSTVKLYGVPVVEMADNIMEWKILGVPLTLFAVTSGYLAFRTFRLVMSFLRLIVVVPALGGGVYAASQLQEAAGKLNEVPFIKSLGLEKAITNNVPAPVVIALPEVITLVEGLLLSAIIGGILLFIQRGISNFFQRSKAD